MSKGKHVHSCSELFSQGRKLVHTGCHRAMSERRVFTGVLNGHTGRQRWRVNCSRDWWDKFYKGYDTHLSKCVSFLWCILCTALMQTVTVVVRRSYTVSIHTSTQLTNHCLTLRQSEKLAVVEGADVIHMGITMHTFWPSLWEDVHIVALSCSPEKWLK